jgi:hypothetical protein
MIVCISELVTTQWQSDDIVGGPLRRSAPTGCYKMRFAALTILDDTCMPARCSSKLRALQEAVPYNITYTNIRYKRIARNRKFSSCVLVYVCAMVWPRCYTAGCEVVERVHYQRWKVTLSSTLAECIQQDRQVNVTVRRFVRSPYDAKRRRFWFSLKPEIVKCNPWTDPSEILQKYNCFNVTKKLVWTGLLTHEIPVANWVIRLISFN